MYASLCANALFKRRLAVDLFISGTWPDDIWEIGRIASNERKKKMKDKLKAIACLGLAVCVASGLWACSREDVQTEPESSNTTINYVYNGIYDISNIPEETLSGEMPVTEIETDTNGETYIVVEQPVQTVQDGIESPRTTLKSGGRISETCLLYTSPSPRD